MEADEIVRAKQAAARTMTASPSQRGPRREILTILIPQRKGQYVKEGPSYDRQSPIGAPSFMLSWASL